jgi:hypothetical protein
MMVISITAVTSIQSSVFLGQEMCDFQATSAANLAGVSVNTIVVMAVNRFVRVCKSLKYTKIFNRKTSLIMIGAVWIVSFTG